MADPAQYLQDLRRLLTGEAPAPAVAPAQVPVVTQSAPTPVPAPQPAAGGQAPSLLEQLRARVSQELASTNAVPQVDPRVVFGRGVLSNRGSFLDNLAAGVAAQEAAETARRDAIRRNLEIERGITEAASREAIERDRLNIERERRDAEAPLRRAQALQAEAMARYYAQGGAGANRGQITPQVRLRAESQALSEARTLFPDPPSTSLTREADAARVQRQRQEYIASRVPALLESLGAPGQAPAAQAAPPPPIPTIEVNPLGRPAR
jgi:hypothetical protein